MSDDASASWAEGAAAVAAVLLLGSIVFSWSAAGDVPLSLPLPAPGAPEPGMPSARSPSLAAAPAPVWRAPVGQSAGPGWVYEIFTPPAVFYDQVAGTFTVTPPGYPGGESAGAGVELLAVERELFPLQLSGFFGGPGNWLAALTSPTTSGTWFVRDGFSFGSLGFTLVSFDVCRVEAAGAGVTEVVGTAVLRENATGREVVLDSRGPRYTDELFAVLRLGEGGARRREVRAGETVSEGEATFRIERIQLDPAEVVIARGVPGMPSSETVILRLSAAGEPVDGHTAFTRTASAASSAEATGRPPR